MGCALIFCPLSVWRACAWVFVSPFVSMCVFQVTFSDAMRSKARLSITGSTGENGRVMSPEFPKAVHAVPFVRPGVGMNVSLTDLSWWIRTCRVPYTMVFNRAHSILFPVAFSPISLVWMEDGGLIWCHRDIRLPWPFITKDALSYWKHADWDKDTRFSELMTSTPP